ncbi:hypothetical protein K6119_02625 [Paracrocinitomix mangrovi]|uniref:hypothetical protein n=1 Tax=Paracrocinitomix mangrovi TaxID=2862509 RepID=UPI001C8D8236|nr:hypothetical protein [Paracrocinitomix mangrovi]UKN02414.1 hypothetical protein K6119_02625 [Paracrocinitomix mangrovi]
MKIKRLIFVAVIMLAVVSCKKEKTTWDTNWSAPLVHGNLTINDLVPSDYTTTNGDNYLSIVYNETAYSVSIDSIIQLPDTSIVESTAFAFPLDVNPGFIWADSADQPWNLGDIEIKQVIAKEGTVTFKLTSEWGGKTKMTMDFPKIILNGTPFYQSYYLPAGSQANPTVSIDAVDMSGYLMDLTGVSGDLYNTLSGLFLIESDEDTASFSVSTSDSVFYEISFTDVVVDYARGYFGQHTFSDTTSIKLPFMDAVLSGAVDVDSIDMTVSIMNGFNLIAQAKLTQMSGINSKTGGITDLSFPQLGSNLNINPATGGIYDWQYSAYPITINNTNSNIAAFIENLPDEILLGYEVIINPNGNITAGTDEKFPGSTLDIVVNGEFPLDIGANQLTLTDTFDISYTGSESYTGNNAEIILDYTNSFPLGADTKLYLLDDNNVVLDSVVADNQLISGTYNGNNYLTTPYSGSILFNLNSQHISYLEEAKKIALIVAFTTDNAQKVKIDASANLDFNLRSNLQISIHL